MTIYQTVLDADVLLRHQARERERHVEEGRVLRALRAPAPGRVSRQAASAGRVEHLSGLRARMSQLWRGLRPAPLGDRRPLHTDSPLLQAAE